MRLACLLATLALAAPGLAFDATRSDRPPVTIMGATKHPISALKAAQSVSVLTREDIRDLNPRSLADLFRLMPGVDVMEKAVDDFDVGAQGLSKELNNQMLVLLDGKPMLDTLYGHTWWRELPIVLDSIDRIEVVRGPGSAQWGANAFAGVINIVTDAGRPRFDTGTRTSTRVGERGYLAQSARVAEFHRDWSVTFTGEYWAADGRTPLTRVDGTPNLRFESIQNTAAKEIGILDMQRMFGKRTKLEVRLSGVHDNTEDPGGFVRRDERQTSQIQMGSHMFWGELAHQYAKRHAASFRVQSNRVDSDYGRNVYFNEDLDPHSTQEDSYVDLELQGRSDLGRSRYIYGLTMRDSVSRGFFIDLPARYITTKAAYAQIEQDLDRRTQGFFGVIVYDSSMTGFDFSPKLSLVREVGRDSVVRFGAGRAFRSPDQVAFFAKPFTNLPLTTLVPPLAARVAADLAARGVAQPVIDDAVARILAKQGGEGTFSPVPGFTGNTKLENEEITQVDLGFEKRSARSLAKLDLWYAEVDHLITSTGTTRTPTFLQTGIAFDGSLTDTVAGLTAELNGTAGALSVPGFELGDTFANQTATLYTRGVTVEAGRTLSSALRLDANATYQDAQIQGLYKRDPDRQVVTSSPYAPHLKYNAIARFRPDDRATVTLTLHHESKRTTSGLESFALLHNLPAFTTVSLAARRELGRRHESAVSLAVHNLFNDVHHELVKELDEVSTEAGGIRLDRQWLAKYERHW